MILGGLNETGSVPNGFLDNSQGSTEDQERRIKRKRVNTACRERRREKDYFKKCIER